MPLKRRWTGNGPCHRLIPAAPGKTALGDAGATDEETGVGMRLIAFAALAVMALLAGGEARAGQTLDAVHARGTLRCGTENDTPGSGAPDSAGNLHGIDIDYCRAVAAAVFGDASKVTFVNTSVLNRFSVLQSGDVDVLIRETTNLFTRDTQIGLIFGPTIVYDAQGALVPTKLGVKTLADLDGASVCVYPGSNSELNIADYFRTHGLKYTPISIDSADAMRRTFFEGRCDVFTGDRLMLSSNRSLAPTPADYVLMPELLAKSPLGPVVRQGDDQWLNIVKWVVYVTFIAEEKKLTSANVDEGLGSKDPEVLRMLGKTPGYAKQLGLADDWALRVIKAVGNYAEIYDRNLGEGSVLKLPRGLNKQWSDGGLLFAPPFL
jgi:general L-amino acid transport system substrate-binding protein